MRHAVRAFGAGLWTVCRSPLLIVSVTLVTLAAAVPFGLVLGSRLQTSLANQPPISLDSGEIDAEWWMEFREHARGLEATFTPTIIGFAAPLDNLSAILDGTPRPLALVGPVALAGLLWAFLWGGLLHRFAQGRAIGLRAFCAAGVRHTPRFVMISLAAAAIYLLLYLTVHALLFGPVYDWLAARASSERNAFFWRVALYLIFGGLLMTVSLVADYARVSVASAAAGSLRGALESGARFVRAHARSVVMLYLLSGALFVALLVTYGSAEVYGGTRVGGWRGVLIGQAYIVARLTIRLTAAAAEMRLFQSLSVARVNPGPPAAT